MFKIIPLVSYAYFHDETIGWNFHPIQVILKSFRVLFYKNNFECLCSLAFQTSEICRTPLTLSFTDMQILHILHCKIWFFSKFFFDKSNRNYFVKKKIQKNLFFIKTPKNNFSDPKKHPLNWSFPTKWYPCLDTSLFCYSCSVHKNLA